MRCKWTGRLAAGSTCQEEGVEEGHTLAGSAAHEVAPARWGRNMLRHSLLPSR